MHVTAVGADKEAIPRKTEHYDKIKAQVTPQQNLAHVQLYRNAMGAIHLVVSLLLSDRQVDPRPVTAAAATASHKSPAQC
jgi:hypothetical protein